MVTGGDDKKVNLWSIGKSSPILSLAGHQSAVECVTFDNAEEVVVAGAAGGTLKLWDLEEAKVVRTLTGHRSNVISVDFHPFGEFFASGSLDCNTKIWDIRRKGCIHTYKGHDRGVSVAKFSPDGKWVLSGGQDGRVKLWDLTAGRLLRELPAHDGPVTSVEFHPNELLVATGSADRTVKFWDLETFDLVDTCVEATGVRSTLFTPEGDALLTGTSEFLKVWRWEPARCCDAVDVSWTKLADLSTHEGKLLGASCSNSFVGVWVVDLAKCEPFHSGKEFGPGGGGTRDAPDRVGANENRPPPTSSGRAEEAVAAAQLAAKARVAASEERAREAAAGEAAAGGAAREPRGSGSVTRNHRIGEASRMEMNTGFAAAHGIGADPLADKPKVVYANPPPPTTPLTRALNLAVPETTATEGPGESGPRVESRDQSDWETDRGSAKDESDADEVIEEDLPPPTEPEPDVVVSPPGGLHDSTELRRSMPPPTIEVHESPAPSPAASPVSKRTSTHVSNATRQSRERKRYVHAATGMGSSRAFDLDALRSAALEAETEFVTPADGGGSSEHARDLGENTLAAAMARARAERERANNGGVGDGGGIRDGRVAEVKVDRGRAPPETKPNRREARETKASPETKASAPPPPPAAAAAPKSPGGPRGINFAAFLPGGGGGGGAPASPPPPSEEEVLRRLGGSDGGTVSGILTARLTTLTACKNMWVKGDTRGVAETLAKSGDQSAVVDVATSALDAPAVAGGHETLTLELAAALTPLMRDLLKSPHASYVDLALRFARTVAQRFMSLLKSAPEAMEAVRRGGIGVDLVGEERATRAWACVHALEALRPQLDAIDRHGGELAPRAREMRGLLDQMSAE